MRESSGRRASSLVCPRDRWPIAEFESDLKYYVYNLYLLRVTSPSVRLILFAFATRGERLGHLGGVDSVLGRLLYPHTRGSHPAAAGVGTPPV